MSPFLVLILAALLVIGLVFFDAWQANRVIDRAREECRGDRD